MDSRIVKYVLCISIYQLLGFILYELAQIEYALNLSEPISLGIVRHHNKEIWRAYSISKNGEMSENGHAHAHIWAKFYLKNRRTWGAHFGTEMFAIDLVDNPVKELFPTFTVFTQFEKTSLAFLNILAKCDFLRTMQNHLWNILKQPSTLLGAPPMIF